MLTIWALLTFAALITLVYGNTLLAKGFLCAQIAIVPGGVLTSIFELKREWSDTPSDEWSNLYDNAPLIVGFIAALVAAYFSM